MVIINFSPFKVNHLAMFPGSYTASLVPRPLVWVPGSHTASLVPRPLVWVRGSHTASLVPRPLVWVRGSHTASLVPRRAAWVRASYPDERPGYEPRTQVARLGTRLVLVSFLHYRGLSCLQFWIACSFGRGNEAASDQRVMDPYEAHL